MAESVQIANLKVKFGADTTEFKEAIETVKKEKEKITQAAPIPLEMMGMGAVMSSLKTVQAEIKKVQDLGRTVRGGGAVVPPVSSMSKLLGMAREQQQKYSDVMGTPNYMSPEQARLDKAGMSLASMQAMFASLHNREVEEAQKRLPTFRPATKINAQQAQNLLNRIRKADMGGDAAESVTQQSLTKGQVYAAAQQAAAQQVAITKGQIQQQNFLFRQQQQTAMRGWTATYQQIGGVWQQVWSVKGVKGPKLPGGTGGGGGLGGGGGTGIGGSGGSGIFSTLFGGISKAQLGISALQFSIGGLVAFSVRAFAQFDDAIIRTMANMRDFTQSNRAMFQAGIFEISGSSITSSRELASALDQINKSGMAAGYATKALAIAEEFAVAGNMNAVEATKKLVEVQRNLNMNGETAEQHFKNMTTLADAFAGMSQMAGVSTEKLMESFGPRFTSAARMHNLSMEDAIALQATYNRMGLEGHRAEEAGTQLLINLTSKSIEHSNAWRQLGVEVYDARGKMKPMTAILSQMDEKIRGLNPQAREAALGLMGFNNRVIQSILPMMGASKEFMRLREEISKTGGVAKQMADMIRGSLIGQLKVLWNNLTNVAIVIGDRIAPLLYPIVNGIVALAQAFLELNSILQTWIVYAGLAAIALAAIWGVMLMLTPLLPTFGAMLGIVAGFLAVAATAALIFAPALAAVAELIGEVSWDDFAEGSKGALTKVIGFFYNFAENVKILWKFLGENWRELFSNMLGIGVAFMTNFLTMVVRSSMSTFQWVANLIATSFSVGFHLAGDLFMLFGQWLIDAFTLLYPVLGNAFQILAEYMSKWLGLGVEIGAMAAVKIFYALAGWLSRTFGDLWQFIWSGAFITAIAAGINLAYENIKTFIENILGAFLVLGMVLSKIMSDALSGNVLALTKAGGEIEKAIEAVRARLAGGEARKEFSLGINDKDIGDQIKRIMKEGGKEFLDRADIDGFSKKLGEALTVDLKTEKLFDDFKDVLTAGAKKFGEELNFEGFKEQQKGILKEFFADPLKGFTPESMKELSLKLDIPEDETKKIVEQWKKLRSPTEEGEGGTPFSAGGKIGDFRQISMERMMIGGDAAVTIEQQQLAVLMSIDRKQDNLVNAVKQTKPPPVLSGGSY